MPTNTGADDPQAARELAAVAKLVALGEATLCGPSRSADVALRRQIAAWMLVDRLGWSRRAVAQAFGRTERAVAKMLRKARRTRDHASPWTSAAGGPSE